MTCSICLEEIKEDNFILEDCEHNFHVKCIMKWFRQGNKTCPICRSDPTQNMNDHLRRIIQDYLENSNVFQIRYQELQHIFSSIDNIDLNFALKLIEILFSLFSLKLKLKLLFSFFISGLCIIVLIPIITATLLFYEIKQYVFLSF